MFGGDGDMPAAVLGDADGAGESSAVGVMGSTLRERQWDTGFGT
jgi:hypothetical protein